MKIIVRMPNWLGDAVMATSIFPVLRKQIPHSKIFALISAQLAPVLEKNPHIDTFIPFVRKKESEKIRRRLREEHFDTGILLTGSFSSAWEFFRGRVPRRIGYPVHYRRLLLTDSVQERAEHQVEAYLRMLTPLGCTAKAVPELFLPEEEVTATANSFSLSKAPIRIGINPGAAYGSAKCWPANHFVILCRKILATYEHAEIFLFGDKGTKPLVDTIASHFQERVHNFASKTTLRELFCLFKTMHLIISNDSGPMHVAAALKVPLIALFGSTDDIKTGPYQHGVVIKEPVFCSPCCLRTCPLDFRCMKAITPERVFTAAQGLLHA